MLSVLIVVVYIGVQCVWCVVDYGASLCVLSVVSSAVCAECGGILCVDAYKGTILCNGFCL